MSIDINNLPPPIQQVMSLPILLGGGIEDKYKLQGKSGYKKWLKVFERKTKLCGPELHAYVSQSSQEFDSTLSQCYDQLIQTILENLVHDKVLSRYENDATAFGRTLFLMISRDYGTLGAREIYVGVKNLVRNHEVENVESFSNNFLPSMTKEQFLGMFYLANLQSPEAENRVLGQVSPDLTVRGIHDAIKDILDEAQEAHVATANVASKGRKRHPCNRCLKRGHSAKDCKAPAPVKKSDAANPPQNQNVDNPLSTEEVATGEQAWVAALFAGDTNHNEFYLDSGATIHVANNRQCFTSLKAHKDLLHGIGGSSLAVCGKGTIKFVRDGNVITLTDVYFVPEAAKNLVSVRKATDNGATIVFRKSQAVDLKTNQVVALRTREGLYRMTYQVYLPATANLATMHSRLGHPSDKVLNQMMHLYKHVDVPLGTLDSCDDCSESKMVLQKPKGITNPPRRPLEIIHTDISGPFPVRGLGDERYFLVVIDGYTRFCAVIPLMKKSDTASTLISIIRAWQTHWCEKGFKVEFVRSDNGTEFKNHTLDSFFSQNGTSGQFTVPYTSHQNGVAERCHRSIQTRARTLLSSSKLSEDFWPEAVLTAAFLQNRLPTNALDGKIPYFLWNGKLPSMDILRPFGCQAHVYVPAEKRSSKFTSTATPGVLVGYSASNKAYRIFVHSTSTIVISNNVKFNEAVFPGSALNHAPKGGAVSGTSAPGAFHPSPLVSSDVNNTQLVRSSQTASDLTINYPPSDIVMGTSSPTSSVSDVEMLGSEISATDGDVPMLDPPSVFKLLPPVESDTQLARVNNPAFTDYSREIARYAPSSEDDSYETASDVSADDAWTPQPLIGHLPRPAITAPPDNHQLILRSSNMDLTPLEEGSIAGDSDTIPDSQPFIVSLTGQEWLEYESDDVSSASNDQRLLGLAATIVSGVPNTYKQAMAAHDSRYWQEAMDKELAAHTKNGTWVWKLCPPAVRPIGSRWVFTLKEQATQTTSPKTIYKARLVAQGFTQVAGVDYSDTFAPVLRYDSLRVLLALAAHFRCNIHQMDVTTAFLYGEVDVPLYMRPPPGVLGPTNHLCFLKRSIYGLKQAPFRWNLVIHGFLTTLGFARTPVEHGIYIKHVSPQIFVIVGLYVDDLLIVGQRMCDIDQLKAQLAARFQMKDLGPACRFLGIELQCDPKKGLVNLSLEKYIENLLNAFNMGDCNPLATPVPTGHNLTDPDASEPLQPSDSTVYRSLIGKLLYASNTVRGDIAYIVGILSRNMAKPSVHHLAAAKRVLRYLKGTANLKLTFTAGKSLRFVGFSDADYAGDVGDRKSTSGCLIQLAGGAISWYSNKQKTVSVSTTEAEYVALAGAVKETVWLLQLFEALGLKMDHRPIIFEDNRSTAILARHPTLHSRTKHIAIKHHFLRDLLVKKVYDLQDLPTKEMVADFLTKALPKPQFSYLRSKAGFNE